MATRVRWSKDPNAGNPFAVTYGLNGTTTNPADMGYPQANLSGLFSTIGTATGSSARIDRNFEFSTMSPISTEVYLHLRRLFFPSLVQSGFS